MVDQSKSDEVRRYEKLAYRLSAKFSALLSAVKTFFYAPRKFRSADIHLLFQSEAQILAQNSLHRRSIDEPVQGQRVLILVPFRDKWEMTARCLESLARQVRREHTYHVILVDNGSIEPLTRQGIEDYLQKSAPSLTYRHLRYDVPFNFSALNNWAVRDSEDLKPDTIFLCNNDIEFMTRIQLPLSSIFAEIKKTLEPLAARWFTQIEQSSTCLYM